MKINLNKKSIKIDMVIMLIGAVGMGYSFFNNEMSALYCYLVIAFRPFMDCLERNYYPKVFYKYLVMGIIGSSFIGSMYVLNLAQYTTAINLFIIALYATYKLYLYYADPKDFQVTL